MERLPVERALTEQTRAFKAIGAQPDGRDPMPGKFVIRCEVAARDSRLGPAPLALPTRPRTGAEHLTVIDVTLDPGKGHDFHKHPDQEEVIVVVAGEVEQWLDREKRVLTPATGPSSPPAWCTPRSTSAAARRRSLAILGPCVGDVGYELVDMAAEAPWNTLR